MKLLPGGHQQDNQGLQYAGQFARDFGGPLQASRRSAPQKKQARHSTPSGLEPDRSAVINPTQAYSGEVKASSI